jgi:hypothetical protein
MNVNGRTLLRRLMTKNGVQAAGSLGRRNPMVSTTGSRKPAASVTRARTMVKTGSSFTAMPTKKNDPPQRTDKTTRSSHCVRDMDARSRLWACGSP